MANGNRHKSLWLLFAIAVCLAGTAGCYTCQTAYPPPDSNIPRELRKVSLPPYVIEPPDILIIDAISILPKPPYRIASLDTLLIQATETLPNEPISGPYVVSPEGTVNLGGSYGTVMVADMTLEDAKVVVENHLKQFLKAAKVTVSLGQSRAMQQIRGEHLVSQDGTINLGVYGQLSVTGLTLPEAKIAVESHLAQYLKKPEISLQVTGYNSKVYYVIFDGGGYGQQMYRLPITGNETVLDALAQINGLPPVASMKNIWVARPAPADLGCDQILPVDLVAITNDGSTATNYQLMPGDRIHVSADHLIHLDNALAKIFAPIERVLGITLLGTETAKSIRFFNTPNATGGGGF
jgi:polysaccharide export outer membrane protein